MKIGDLEIKWLGHSGFLIKDSLNIYIDPYNISEKMAKEKADLIFLTHGHYDHCSLDDLNKIIQEGTKIICPADCQSKIARFEVPVKIQLVEPNQDLEVGSLNVSTFPAYNINKPFHEKDNGSVGFLIKIRGDLFYHAGDTDKIPEMQKLTGYQADNFIAFLPVGGRFTMDAEEAAEAAELIKPSLAIPIHYGSIIGNKENAEEFADFCKEKSIKTKILEKE